MEYLSAYPSTPTPAMILTPPARALSPSPPPEPEPEPEPVASTSRRVIDHILLPRLPADWLSAPPTGGPVLDDKACHQCRNSKNPHPRYRCGRAGCVRTYCTSCLSRRYAWTPADIHAAGCPGCRGVCNCSLCLDRAGLGAHKAFLTAAARSGGCARTWLAARGLLVEGAAAPSAAPKKKNMARRPRILSKKTGEGKEVGPWKAPMIKHAARNADDDEDDTREEGQQRRGRWMIDASVAACAKFARRWARERAARGAQVRAGARRWFVGASPPPRASKRRAAEDTAAQMPVETIDLTLDDDEDDEAPDSLFDGPAADPADARDSKTADGAPVRNDGEKTEDDAAPGSPDSLFDEKTEDEEAPAAAAQNHAPAQDVLDDKSDAHSLFDGTQRPTTPLLPPPTPLHLTPVPIQLPPTPVQLAPTPIQLPPTPIQLPPASPIVPTQDALSRSDSYADALRVDAELAVASAPGSPDKILAGADDGQVVLRDPFAATPGSASTALPPASAVIPAPAAALSPVPADPTPAQPPKSPPKTSSKAASAMFIPRAKPVAKRKRDENDGDENATRLTEVKSSAGVLVPLGRPGRAKRVREEEVGVGVGREDAHAQDKDNSLVLVSKDDASVRMDDPAQKNDAPVSVQKDEEPVRMDDALAQDGSRARKDDVPQQKNDAPLPAPTSDVPMWKTDAPMRHTDAPTQKRPREDDVSALVDARPAKRAALSKETARKPRAVESDTISPLEPEDVDTEPPARSKQTARKPRAASSTQQDSNIVDGLPTPKATLDKRTAEANARPSAADALAQAMRAAYGGGGAASTSDPTTSAPVASSSSARDPKPAEKRSKPSVLAQRVAQASGSTLAVALKPLGAGPSASTAPAPAPSMASALAAAFKQAYATSSTVRAASPVSTLRSSPSPVLALSPLEQDGHDKSGSSPTTTVRASIVASKTPAPGKTLHDELSKFIGGLDDDKDDDEPTPELLPSDLAAQSEGSSRTGPVSPVVAPRRPPKSDDEQEELPARRPFVPCSPRQFVGLPLRFVPAKKRARPRPKKLEVDDEDEQDFGLARRRKRARLWEESALQQQRAREAVIVLDDSDDSDFQPSVSSVTVTSKGKGKAKSVGPGKGKTKPRKSNALPLSSFIAYSYTPPPPEQPPEPVFVPDDDTAAALPESEVWLGAAMAPLSPDLGLTRAVADAWFGSAV